MVILPEVFDYNLYRSLHPDLQAAGFDDAGLLQHYNTFGINEGRIANPVSDRASFLSIIPAEATVLEIMPGYTPLMNGSNSYLFDTHSAEQLKQLAKGANIDTSSVRHIHYVSPTGDWSVVDRRFDYILLNQELGKHPNLATFLDKLGSLLHDGGFVFAILPNKQYGSNFFNPDASLAEVLTRYYNSDDSFSAAHTVAATAIQTHTSADAHWNGNHGDFLRGVEQRIAIAMSLHKYPPHPILSRALNAYYFTPASLEQIITVTAQMGLHRLRPVRIYPTVRNKSEFFVILQKA